MKSSKLVALGAACAFMIMGDTALAQGDPAAGATAFARCRACHLFDDSGKHRVGPNLAGMFGRTAGTVEDHRRTRTNARSAVDRLQTPAAAVVPAVVEMVAAVRDVRVIVRVDLQVSLGVRERTGAIDARVFPGPYLERDGARCGMWGCHD